MPDESNIRNQNNQANFNEVQEEIVDMETDVSDPSMLPCANATPPSVGSIEGSGGTRVTPGDAAPETMDEMDTDEDYVDPLLADLLHQVYLFAQTFDRMNPQPFAQAVHRLIAQHPEHEGPILMFVALLLGKDNLELLNPVRASTMDAG